MEHLNNLFQQAAAAGGGGGGGGAGADLVTGGIREAMLAAITVPSTATSNCVSESFSVSISEAVVSCRPSGTMI